MAKELQYRGLTYCRVRLEGSRLAYHYCGIGNSAYILTNAAGDGVPEPGQPARLEMYIPADAVEPGHVEPIAEWWPDPESDVQHG